MKTEDKQKYGYGYDVGSKMWIVGIKTERGTIKDVAQDHYFETAEEAEEKAKELNNERII